MKVKIKSLLLNILTLILTCSISLCQEKVLNSNNYNNDYSNNYSNNTATPNALRYFLTSQKEYLHILIESFLDFIKSYINHDPQDAIDIDPYESHHPINKTLPKNNN